MEAGLGIIRVWASFQRSVGGVWGWGLDLYVVVWLSCG